MAGIEKGIAGRWAGAGQGGVCHSIRELLRAMLRASESTSRR